MGLRAEWSAAAQPGDWMPQEPQTGAVTTGGSGVEGPASHAGTPRHHWLQLLSAPRPPPGQPWTAPTRDEDLRTPSNPLRLGQELPGAVAKWEFPSRHRPGLPPPAPPGPRMSLRPQAAGD